MGFYKKTAAVAGEKTAASLLKIFAFLKSLPFKIERFFKIFSNRIKKPFIKEKRIFLVGTPGYGNLGDQLIAVGELRWLKDFYHGTEIIPCPQEELLKDKNLRLLFSRIKKDDLIFLQGGGNLNNLYLLSEGIRRKVILGCKKNKIVLFQQSINLHPPVNGVSIKAETEKIYNSHPNFTIIAREDTSYSNALESFPKVKVLKYPDMATYLFGKIGPSHFSDRNGVVFCLRNDKEKFYSDALIKETEKAIRSFSDVTLSDTHVGHTVSEESRSAEVQKLIDSIANHKVMVTDRFHGVVFSILANTPCVVLRSADHKITDGIRWFKDVEGVFFAEDIADVPELVKKAEKFAPVKQPDFSLHFEKMYQNLK